MKNEKLIFGIAILIMLATISFVVNAQTYNLPERLSPYDVANWTLHSGFIASGTVEPTAVASEGQLYWNNATPTAPILWCYFGGWRKGTSSYASGTIPHDSLVGLDYDASGHTGFARDTDIPNNASFTLNDLGEKDYSNLNGKPTSASWTLLGLFEKEFASLTDTPTTLSGYGILDAALDSDLLAHIADTIDPHGDEMQVTKTVTVGDGTDEDAYIGYVGTATPVIGDYFAIPHMATAPVSIGGAHSTFWFDSVNKVLKMHDGVTWIVVSAGEKSGTFAYLTTASDTVCTLADTYYPIMGIFNNDITENFTASTTPALIYDGLQDGRYFEIDWHATISATSANTTIHCSAKVNGVDEPPTTMGQYLKNANQPYTLSGTIVVALDTDDAIQLTVRSDLAANTLTFHHYTTTIRPFFN